MGRHLLFTLLAALACWTAAAQQRQDPVVAAALQENNLRASVNDHVYEFGPLTDTPAPKGYKPFYISHYGRHGTRSDWGAGDYLEVANTLEKAGEAGLLTPEGDSLRAEAMQVYLCHDGMDGRLTQHGVHEHEHLAERMYARYPQVFRKGCKQVRSISSVAQRCIISMVGFTNRLNELQPDLTFYWDTGEKFMKYISNETPKDVLTESASLLAALDRSYVPDTAAFLRRLFTDPDKARAFVPDAVTFERKVFNTARIAQSFDLPVNVYRHLPFDAIYKWYEYITMDIYLRQANSAAFGERRIVRAEPLVQDFVEKADEAIRQGNWAADLRFGHDYPLLAFAGYLGLEGVGDRLEMDEVIARWHGWENIPFASNMQVIFYRNKKGGDVLVKFLYNEKETLLRGLTPVQGPYYRWNDVRENIRGYLR